MADQVFWHVFRTTCKKNSPPPFLFRYRCTACIRRVPASPTPFLCFALSVFVRFLA